MTEDRAADALREKVAEAASWGEDEEVGRWGHEYATRMVDALLAAERERALREAAADARGMHDPPATDCAEWADWLDARADRLGAEPAPGEAACSPLCDGCHGRSCRASESEPAPGEGASRDCGRCGHPLGDAMESADHACPGKAADRPPEQWSESDRRDLSAWLVAEADERVRFFPQRRDGVDALMRHIAAELRVPATPNAEEESRG